MFYEANNDLGADALKIERGTDFNFPSHLHGSFELITVTSGELNVKIDKKDYVIEKGQMLLIFPNQVHELSCSVSCSHFLCIFSPKLIAAYSKRQLSRIPLCNLFSPSQHIMDSLLSLSPDDSIFKIKGLLYSICAEFDTGAIYREREEERDSLLPIIFRFVEKNFSGDCSLYALAKDSSYSYEYLSKYFSDHTGITFTDYVCRYRISEACYILQNTNQTILITAFECGFDSLRSFNRNFKKVTNMTPSEYRSKFN